MTTNPTECAIRGDANHQWREPVLSTRVTVAATVTAAEPARSGERLTPQTIRGIDGRERVENLPVREGDGMWREVIEGDSLVFEFRRPDGSRSCVRAG